jgi:hypothetical protein
MGERHFQPFLEDIRSSLPQPLLAARGAHQDNEERSLQPISERSSSPTMSPIGVIRTLQLSNDPS